jgi:hypothetical protein
MLLVVVATTSHARDIKAEFLQWCGKTTLGEFAADNAANAGSDAPAGSVYFPPQAGLTFAGKPLQAVLIKEGTRTSPDIYGVTIQGPARSVTARLTGAGHKARTRTSAFSPGATLGARCVGWYAVTSDLRDDGHWGGFQLRTEVMDDSELNSNCIVGGYGYEFDCWDVPRACREGLVESFDGHEDVRVRADLLHWLAHPFAEHDKRR